MTTFPSSVSPTPAVTDASTLNVALECLKAHLPLSMQGECQPQTVYEVLLWAASHHDSIEHSTQQLTGVPSSNDLRYHLDKFADMATVERQVNAALHSHLPLSIANHRHCLALDLHLLPYYGRPSAAEAPYIYRSEAKAGTTSFFAYATMYVIRAHQRLTLAIHAIYSGESAVAIITRLLDYLNPLAVRVKRLYLDRGFYSVPVIRWLMALNLPFIMPAIIRGKTGGTRALCQGRTSYQTTYTLTSTDYGTVNCPIVVVCRYHKGAQGQHGVQYRLYVVYRAKVALHQVHHHYRHRFGIETSYRIKNHCRIRSTTKNPVLRLLYVAIAFILVNLWIYLLWQAVSLTRRGGRRIYQERFRLKTMLEFLSYAVERHFPVIHAVYLPMAP
jgi:Transposase DDE domain